MHDTPPGAGRAYDDMRIDLLTQALTALLGRSLQDVLRDEVMEPIGAGSWWPWHGCATSCVRAGDVDVPVVGGGAHWGGRLFVPAHDLALLGQLFLDGGRAHGHQVLSRGWVERSWRPCPIKPEYGLLWWLDDTGVPRPGAPRTGRSARGNGGRHLLWVDPARDLVLCSRWGEDPARLIAEVSAAVTPG